MVSIERTIENVPSVSCDNYQGGVLAAKTLIGGGCKYPLVFGHKTGEYLPAQLPLSGFRDECERCGIEYREYLLDENDLFAECFAET